jgi:predicted kinase
MGRIIIGMGLPGSGKTKTLRELVDKYGYDYVCPDDLRNEMLGNAADQSRNKEVWDEAYKRVADRLSEGKTVVFDATFADESQRKNFIVFAREHGAEKIQGLFVDAPFDVAEERNKARERIVPDHAMKRMEKGLRESPPEIADGFDSLFTVDEYQKLKTTELEYHGHVLKREHETVGGESEALQEKRKK